MAISLLLVWGRDHGPTLCFRRSEKNGEVEMDMVIPSTSPFLEERREVMTMPISLLTVDLQYLSQERRIASQQNVVYDHDHSILYSRKGDVVTLIIPISTSPLFYLSLLRRERERER